MAHAMINLMLGDCLERMKEIPDKSVDLVLTDIPYGEVNRAKESGLRAMKKGIADEVTFDVSKSIDECLRISKGSIYIFCGIEQVSEIRRTLVVGGCMTRLCIWEKKNPSPMNGQFMWLSSIECCVFGKFSGATFNEFCKSAVWRHNTEPKEFHPTAKPVELMAKLIKASSNEGDTVLDFTMGSGTTGVAAKKLKRNFIGIEKDETYFNIAKKRIENGESVYQLDLTGE
jgi:site-specific DNA-methyltransferase (adenine-specific)